MKKISLLITLLALSACSSSSVKETKTEGRENTVTEAPVAVKEEPKAAVAEEPVRPAVVATPSQYSALNEAIKAQSDERIYQAATHILTQSPNDAKALNALAMYHYKRGRFDLCRYFLGKAIASNPKMAELYSNLGIVQLAQGERREAIKSFRKALDINSDEAVAAANLGAIYVQEKDYGKAQIVLETAYKRGVRDARVLNNYAIALTANRKYEKAQDLYEAVLKDNANNKEALFNYASLLVENMGKYQEGLEVINRLKFVGGPADTRNRIIALENKAKAGLK
ncbi:tetratricopeptide repeat protein [Bdellovibrio bacteriovorus]|uniref:tetratricopeptide repeat protein n=1 Tax=Bdellovibrio bacteriovorus TaxID=959 RepID=UPI0035A68623